MRTTPYTVDELMVMAEATADKDEADRLLAKAAWLEESGRKDIRFIGDDEVPFGRGDEVVIPKGTMVSGMLPPSIATHYIQMPNGRRRACKLYKRDTRVKLHDIYDGRIAYPDGFKANGILQVVNPVAVYAGPGGYWCHVDVNDVIPLENGDEP